MATMEELKRMLAGKKTSSNFERKNFYKFPAGMDEVKIRLLPAWEGSEIPFKPTMQHFDIPGSNKPLSCLKLHGLECPICEVLEKYEGQSRELYQYQAKPGAAANALIRKDTTQQVNAKEPMPIRLSEAQLEFFMGLMEEGNVADAYEGRDIIVKRKKYNGAFEMRPAFSASSIGDDESDIQSILSKLTDFDKHPFFQKPNDDDVNMVLKCARELDDMIENKILAHGTSNAGAADKAADDSEPTMHEEEPPKVVKKPEATKPVNKPAAIVARPAAAAAAAAVAKPVASPMKPVAKPATANVHKPMAAKPTIVAKPEVKRVEGAPAGAPNCFGLENEYIENSEKCTKCEYEYQCSGVIAASK